MTPEDVFPAVVQYIGLGVALCVTLDVLGVVFGFFATISNIKKP